jgi:hypothetical protein
MIAWFENSCTQGLDRIDLSYNLYLKKEIAPTCKTWTIDKVQNNNFIDYDYIRNVLNKLYTSAPTNAVK